MTCDVFVTVLSTILPVPSLTTRVFVEISRSLAFLDLLTLVVLTGTGGGGEPFGVALAPALDTVFEPEAPVDVFPENMPVLAVLPVATLAVDELEVLATVVLAVVFVAVVLALVKRSDDFWDTMGLDRAVIDEVLGLTLGLAPPLLLESLLPGPAPPTPTPVAADSPRANIEVADVGEITLIGDSW